LCDEATYRSAVAQVSFDDGEQQALKGLSDPISVFPPNKGRGRVSGIQRRVDASELVGRAEERTELSAALEAVKQGESRTLLIEGDAGIDKPMLVGALASQARLAGLRWVSGGADPYEIATPYFAFRAVFADLLELDPTAPAETNREAIHDRLRERLTVEPELARLGALLEPVLPLAFEDDDATASLTGEVRADNTRALLVAVVRQAARKGPLAITIEDGHWLDSTSWALAAALEAKAMAERTTTLARRSHGVSLQPFNGLAALAEVVIALARLEGTDTPSLGRLARFACGRLEVLTRVYPIMQPAALLWKGAYAGLRGETSRARRELGESMVMAKRHAMNFDLAAAVVESARVTENRTERDLSLARALDLFAEMGARADADRARALLKQNPS
jgi:hypothetical protein